MTQVLGAWTDGLILALVALGVFLAFRVFRFSDITVDGTYALGAAVAAVLLVGGWHPLAVIPVVFLTGAAFGAVTGTLHTKFGINPLLSGILVMTGLYSITLRVMGKSNLPLGTATTVATYAGTLGRFLTGGAAKVRFLGWDVYAIHIGLFVLSAAVTAAVGVALYAFLRTNLGTAMRATGDNDQMMRALGVNVDGMLIAGLALSNGLVAAAGALYAQSQNFADVQMGLGTLLLGLASVIIGEALVGGSAHLGLAITGAVMGSILYRLVINLVLRAGMDPNDQKLFTAVFVFIALILPDVLKRLRARLTLKTTGERGA